jgi:hypothetical protein
VYDIIIVIVFIRPMHRADGMYMYGRSSLSVHLSACYSTNLLNGLQ